MRPFQALIEAALTSLASGHNHPLVDDFSASESCCNDSLVGGDFSCGARSEVEVRSVVVGPLWFLAVGEVVVVVVVEVVDDLLPRNRRTMTWLKSRTTRRSFRALHSSFQLH